MSRDGGYSIVIAFVILHYQTIEETEKCVDSILSMNQADNARIVVVDNASPNGSGEILQEKWKNNARIEVILNKENSGFSRGNNVGCIYARDTWNPDYYVVANNDIVFEQKNFINLVEQEYVNSQFHVLGPDIYDMTNRVHQSPVSSHEPPIVQVRRTIVLNSLCLMIYPIAYIAMKRYYRTQNEKAIDVDEFDKYQINPLIMGACIIFSKKYVEERLQESSELQPFYPETRFYYEEAILCNWCRKNGKKIVYSPEIKVKHINGGATRSNKDDYNRIRFQMTNIRDAAKVYCKELVK